MFRKEEMNETNKCARTNNASVALEVRVSVFTIEIEKITVAFHSFSVYSGHIL